ncbi:MAG: hypothetical protein ACRYGC_02500 [Janthinobacterium lividum]
MTRLPLLALMATSALSLGAITAASAAPEHHRVRGTVVSVDAGTLVVHPATGSDVTVALSPDTKYAKVVKSDLSKVDKDSYIGTATKSVGDQLVALEVVIFPAAMRGAGDGHYDWDKISDTTTGGHATASSMTNGNVEAAAPAGGAKTVSSAMTNGNVDTAADKGGAKQIVVSYKGGKQTIVVPPTAPIVSFVPGDMSLVTKGATVFVNGTEDAGKVSGGFVAVGSDGVVPPM